MSAFLQATVLAAEKTPDEEGFDIILVMLFVGLIFVGVIVLGQLGRYMGHKRTERRAQRRAY